MATEWYYAKDGEKLGPVTTEGLKELAASGQLDPQDLVWRTGLEGWQPADRVRGLFPGGTMPPPLPIPTSERQSKLGPAREPSDPKQQSSAKLGNDILDAAKGIADKARRFAGSVEVKDAVGRTKKAVADVGDRAKDAARNAREYAGSDEVKEAMSASRRRVTVLSGKLREIVSPIRTTLGNRSRWQIALLGSIVIVSAFLLLRLLDRDHFMVGIWKNPDGTSYQFLSNGTGVWNSPWGGDHTPFNWSLEDENLVVVKGMFGGDRRMPLGPDKQTFVFTPIFRNKETFAKIK